MLWAGRVDAMALNLLGWRGTQQARAVGSLNSDTGRRRMAVNYRDKINIS
jgi:hypothetical protein